VRLEGLRALSNDTDLAARCQRYTSALDDPWLPVALTAIDGLAVCPDGVPVLTSLATGAWSERGWQPRAHALVSLSRLAATEAGEAIVLAAAADPWQVRMYAARAAGETGDMAVLRQLAVDAVANVRHAAVRALSAREGHAADDLYLEALTDGDYQLVMAAAGALAGSPDPRALPAAMDALARITGEERETSRDPRAALLRTVFDLGSADHADEVEPYLRDFDPAIASQAAEMITDWTGITAAATPQRLPAVAFPTAEQLEELAGSRAALHMANGDTITLRLLPYDAPTHTARFVDLARTGYFDGLTLHRVVFNFVLQGGSPGANEYMGDGAFARDEITAFSHRRGTVGTSTRGRDTADGQLFINLADNLRLDFNYTIFAQVVEGDAALDNVLEGAVIESITIAQAD